MRVTWESSAPGPSWVEYGDGMRTNVVDDGETKHEAALLGLPPLTDVSWTAITDTGRRVERCEGELRTGNAPSLLPQIEVRVDDPELRSADRWLGGVLHGPTGSTAFVIDRQGRWVFYQPSEIGRVMIDAEWPEAGVLAVNVFDGSFSEDVGEIREIPLAGGDPVTLRTPLGHHVFAVVPGGYAWLALDVREWTDPESGEVFDVAGDAVVVTDRATGASRTVWSTWDSFRVSGSPDWVTSSIYPGLADWTHGNGLNWNPAEDTLLYSSPRLSSVVELSRTDGAVLRTLGRGGEAQPPPEAPLSHVHDPSLTPEGHLLVSVRHAELDYTGAREYRIEGKDLVPQWEYGFEEELTAQALGQATRLPSGNTLVNYATAGVIQEVTPEGAVAWEIRSELGSSFANVRLVDTLYPADD